MTTMNWDSLAGTASGITVVVVAIVFTIQRAIKKWGTDDPAPEARPTRIITTDTVAVHELAGEISALYAAVTEIKVLISDEIAVRNKERAEQDRDEEIDRESTRKAQLMAEDMVRKLLEEDRAGRHPPRRPTG